MFKLLGNHCFLLLSLSNAKVRALARPYRLINYHMLVVSYILTTPYVLSLILTIAIYAMPPPPRAIKGVRGLSINYYYTIRRARLPRYLLYLGPSY